MRPSAAHTPDSAFANCAQELASGWVIGARLVRSRSPPTDASYVDGTGSCCDIGLPMYLARAPVRPDLLCPLEFGHCARTVAPQMRGEARPVGLAELDLLGLVHHGGCPGER
jgi:hypothetical protein